MRRFALLCSAALLLSVRPASAQFIGTFSWQTQPFCNRITVNVTQAGNAYILEGFDDQCGTERRAPSSARPRSTPTALSVLACSLSACRAGSRRTSTPLSTFLR
jgi:hypothetical protein